MNPTILSKRSPLSLNSLEISALKLAENAARYAYAPHGSTLVGAAFVPDADLTHSGVGQNTNGEDRQRLCAEKIALLNSLQYQPPLQIANSITLAIHTMRSDQSSPQHPLPPAPLTPCGACLHDIQALANLGISPEKIDTLISNGFDTYSVPFTKLYPLATVGQLRSFIDSERKSKLKTAAFSLRDTPETSAELANKLAPDLTSRAIRNLLIKLNISAGASCIEGHHDLKISVGRLCKSADQDLARPLIDFGLFGEASGLVQTLCSGSLPIRPGPHQLLGLAILVKGDIKTSNKNYPLLSGPDRQRLVDISALSGQVIPIIISLNNEAFIVTTIADLAPGYRTPRDSGSAKGRLHLYTRALNQSS
jgi:cytidine deaminase